MQRSYVCHGCHQLLSLSSLVRLVRLKLSLCVSFSKSLLRRSSIAITPVFSCDLVAYAPQVAGGGGGAALCPWEKTCASTAIPVPAMPPGAAVVTRASGLPKLLYTRSPAESSTFGGALYNFGL